MENTKTPKRNTNAIMPTSMEKHKKLTKEQEWEGHIEKLTRIHEQIKKPTPEHKTKWQQIVEIPNLMPHETIPHLIQTPGKKTDKIIYLNKIKRYRDSETQRRKHIKENTQEYAHSEHYTMRGMIENSNKMLNKYKKVASQNNMTLVWRYAKKYRTKSTKSYQPVNKENGQTTQNTQEETQRWTEWIKEQFHKPQHQLKLNIAHIQEEQWGQQEQQLQQQNNTELIQTTPGIQIIREMES